MNKFQSSLIKVFSNNMYPAIPTKCLSFVSSNHAQWEFGQPTLTPTNLEDKTEVKVDKLRYVMT